MANRRGVWSVIVALCASGWLVPEAVAAQDCGLDCEPRGWFGAEGQNWYPQGGYDMDCDHFTSHCTLCGPNVTTGSPSDFVSADEVVRLLLEGRQRVVARTLDAFEDRLLVDPDRRLLVVRGSACAPESVEAVLFLTADLNRALAGRWYRLSTVEALASLGLMREGRPSREG